jgi:bacterioferritin-associated ferredoxin
MPVDRCICHQITFEEIYRIAQERGLRTVEEIQTEKLCSTSCRLCQPYIEEMLRTGRTVFSIGEIPKKRKNG